MKNEMAVRTTWGNWHYDGGTFALVFKNSHNECDVNLDSCCDSAQVLDWIMQMRKTWTTTVDLGDLVVALGDILHPQATICSFGINKEIDPRQVAEANGYAVPHGKAKSE